jgi:hypothetical protein
MKSLLYLTNKSNGFYEEDTFLIDRLKLYYKVIVCHPLECKKYLNEISGVVIRNVWPTSEYREGWEHVLDSIRSSKLPTFNSLDGSGDITGKEYLIELYKKKLPVIPSISSLSDLDKLPETESYWVKPFFGCDGEGSQQITTKALGNFNLKGYIIQPYIEFTSEPSFYYLDNKFLYAVEMPNRLKDTGIKLYTPTKEDIEFAEKFINWNSLSVGIQRIDAVRTKAGSLLLTEIEDVAEYLYLLDIEPEVREKISDALIDTIRRVII